MNIEWTTDHPEAEYSSRTGRDEAGNAYYENACREMVTVETPDGRTGQGWTPEEALRNAMTKPEPTQHMGMARVNSERTVVTILSDEQPLSFETTYDELELLHKIAVRADEGNCLRMPAVDIRADLLLVHTHGTPLDFQKLLASPEYDFVHDVCGIQEHIERRTEKLSVWFFPRCARRDIDGSCKTGAAPEGGCVC